MREGWELKKLSEVCDKTYNIKWSDHANENFEYIDLSSVSRDSLTITESDTINSKNAPSRAKKIVLKNDVIFATTRPTLKRATIINEEYDHQICSTGYAVLRPRKGIVNAGLIYYYILSEAFMLRMEGLQRGASYPAVSDKDVIESSLWVPKSLPEQRQIVAILDQAFAAIDQAKANIEKNIQNAKELFQSKLNEIFSQKGDGWEEKKFKDVCVLQRGFDLPTGLREKGKYDLVTSSGVTDSHSEYKVEGPGVITGRSGSIGNVFYVENNFWPLNTALYIKDFKANNVKYVYYFLRSFDLSRYASGSGVPTLNRNFVHDEVVLTTENKEIQRKVIDTLDSLFIKSEELASSYKSKLLALEELKKSILQKAFAGELSESRLSGSEDQQDLGLAAEPKVSYSHQETQASSKT